MVILGARELNREFGRRITVAVAYPSANTVCVHGAKFNVFAHELDAGTNQDFLRGARLRYARKPGLGPRVMLIAHRRGRRKFDRGPRTQEIAARRDVEREAAVGIGQATLAGARSSSNDTSAPATGRLSPSNTRPERRPRGIKENFSWIASRPATT